MKKTVLFTNASKGIKYLEINVNQELKDLHRIMDSETGILGWNPCSLDNLLSDSGQITQKDLRLNHFNCKMNAKPVPPPRVVKLKGNAYLDQGVGGSPAVPLLVLNFSGAGLSSSCGQGSNVELGSQKGLDQNQDKNDTSYGSGREATSFPELRVGPEPRTGVRKIRSDNSEPPTAGMASSWQEPSLWSRLQCDVVLLPEFSMSPPAPAKSSQELEVY